VFYGNALNQLDSQQTYLSSDTAQLAEQASTVGGADLPAVISNLTTAQTSLEATLESIGQTSQLDLFNYLK
jgi:flagellin-like hook-associated protein FlgL